MFENNFDKCHKIIRTKVWGSFLIDNCVGPDEVQTHKNNKRKKIKKKKNVLQDLRHYTKWVGKYPHVFFVLDKGASQISIGSTRRSLLYVSLTVVLAYLFNEAKN